MDPKPANLAKPAARPEPVLLFYSYAHEDEALRDELAGHLKILERRGLIRAWHDRQILAGQDWHQAIDQHLGQAELVLLLISKDFIGSDYIFGVELERTQQRCQAGGCEVVPILVRAVNVEPGDFWFMDRQGLPPDLKPVTSWPNRDEAWTAVAKGLRRTVEAIQARRPAQVEAAVTDSAPVMNDVALESRSDPLLDQVVGRIVQSVDQAQQRRGGPPLYDHHRHLAEQEARALIDLAEPPRLLWVDDRPEGNRHERALLAQLQIEVVCAISTAQALGLLGREAEAGEPFDLVISDWHRPRDGRDSGLELLQAMRAAGQPQPLLLYHGEFDPARRAVRAARAHAAGALGEAALPGELLALVQLALRGPRRHRAF
ncbi:MAG: TIR domain-containing protein [Burkholderiaceae bacterium]|nr:TIR domain-containing protein [Burkholderiaceae bacterium]